MNGFKKQNEELLNDISTKKDISVGVALNIIRKLNNSLKNNTKEYNFELVDSVSVGKGITGLLGSWSEIGIRNKKESHNFSNKGLLTYFRKSDFDILEFSQLIISSFHEYAHCLQINNKWEELEKTVDYIRPELKERIHIDMCLSFASKSLYELNYDKMTHEIQAVQYSLLKGKEFLINLGVVPKIAEDLIVEAHNNYIICQKPGINFHVRKKKYLTGEFENFNDIIFTANEELNNFENFFFITPDYHYDDIDKKIDVMYKLWDDVDLRKELLSENISQKTKNEKMLIFFAKNIDEFVDKNIQKYFWKRMQDSFPEFIKIVEKDRDVKIPKLEPKRNFGGLFS